MKIKTYRVNASISLPVGLIEQMDMVATDEDDFRSRIAERLIRNGLVFEAMQKEENENPPTDS